MGTRRQARSAAAGLLAALLIVHGATATFAAEKAELSWRKPKSANVAAGSSSSAATRRDNAGTRKTALKDSDVRQASATSAETARSPVLNAAGVEPAAPRAARASEDSVVRRPQSGRFTAQAEPKPGAKEEDNDVKKILEDIAPPKDDAKPPTPEIPAKPEMKEKQPAVDDLPPPPAERRPPGRLDDLDLPKEKPEPSKIDEAQPKPDDLRPKFDEDIMPKPRTKDDALPPVTDEQPSEERCREEEALRRKYLLGEDLEQGRRREGDLEYCAKAIDELKALRVADPKFTIDISPPRPEGVEAPRCDRDWRDYTGRILFRGRPHDFDAQGNIATFRTVDGELKTIRMSELSAEDVGHFAMMYHLPVECVLEQSDYRPRSWVASTFVWKASALCHKPTYFEDEHLERYGHSCGPILQPIVSAGHFFGTIPVLPYKIGLTPPNECLYTLGYYRPGNCAPYMLDPIPLSVRAAALQASAVTAGVAAVP